MKRKRLTNRRPRQISLIGMTSGIVEEINVTFDLSTRSIQITELDPATLRSQVSYERVSGKDKILASVPASSDLPAFDLLAQLKGQASYLVAIDTNTRDVCGRRISVSMACAVPGRLTDHRDPIPFDPLCAYAIFDAASHTNPERIGWHLLLRHHIALAKLGISDRVGVVVDSELGLLPKMNSRMHNYYADHVLPANVVMLYGTSDAGDDSLVNAMIRYCDKYSSLLLDRLTDNLDSLPPLSPGDSNYAGHLAIQFKTEEVIR